MWWLVEECSEEGGKREGEGFGVWRRVAREFRREGESDFQGGVCRSAGKRIKRERERERIN